MVPTRSKCHLFFFFKATTKFLTLLPYLVQRKKEKKMIRGLQIHLVLGITVISGLSYLKADQTCPFLHQGKEVATALPADRKSTIRVSHEQKGEEAEFAVRSVTPPSPNPSPLFPHMLSSPTRII